MPVVSFNDISGGIRRPPTRLFPPNGVKYAKNVLASVEDNIFQTSSPVEGLYVKSGANDPTFIEGINSYFDGVEVLFLIYQLDTNVYYFAYYDGSLTDVNSLGSEQESFKILSVGDGTIIHPFVENPLFTVSAARKIYKKLKYTRNNVEYEETNLFEIPSAPTLSDPTIDIDAIASTDMTDDVPVILAGNATGYYSVMNGYQINGYESICSKDADTDQDSVVENVCIRVEIEINPTALTEIVSGIDIYLVHTLEFPLHGSDDISDEYNWMFVDSIPMDRDEEIVGSTSCSVSGNVITCSTKTWATNQWKGFVAEIGGNYHLIESSAASTLTVKGSPSGVSVKIHSRWIEHGGEYYIAKYITADEGESLVDRCGVSNLKIKSSYDYCPVAKHIEYFKGFVWMADFVDRDGNRYRTRLISNVMNSEGQSCYSVFDTDIYIEFKSDILGMKSFDDYLLVATGDGIYIMRFVPSQQLISYNWTTKKVSNVKIPNSKYISGVSNLAFLFDNYHLYSCDGYDVKLLTNDEVDLIIRDYTSATEVASNSYSILYCEGNSNLYMCLDEVLAFKGGVIEHKGLNTDTDIGNLFGIYDGNPVYFFDNYINVIRIVSDNKATSFDVEFHRTDLGTKEDKYFVVSSIRAYKGVTGDAYIEVYLDDVLMKTITMDHYISYDQCFDIVLPKSNGRRFSNIYFKMHGSTWDSDGIDFRLKTLDVEIDPVRKTLIP
jgi:hypothetical protein